MIDPSQNEAAGGAIFNLKRRENYIQINKGRLVNTRARR